MNLLEEQLKQLRLTAILQAYQDTARQAAQEGWP